MILVLEQNASTPCQRCGHSEGEMWPGWLPGTLTHGNVDDCLRNLQADCREALRHLEAIVGPYRKLNPSARSKAMIAAMKWLDGRS